MSTARYLLGVVLLVLVAYSLAGTARALRARFVAGWSGLTALLVDLVIGLTIVTGLGELLGSVGLFRLAPMVVAVVACYAVSRFVVRARVDQLPATDAPVAVSVADRPDAARAASAIAVVAVAVVVATWTAPTIAALAHGITNIDSNWYHLPVAARFVQQGSVTHVQYLDGGALTAFYPASTPILHGFAMMLMGSDVLSPLVNLAFLGFAFVGAWCLGRPFGVGPAALVGAAMVLGTPMLVTTQPGGAYNDVVGVALFLAAIAILANDHEAPVGGGGAIVIAALAAGLALGTKYQFILPVAGLSLGVIAVAPRGRRRQRAVLWFVPTLLAGGFYYLRNLIVLGNPVPAAAIHLGPLSLPSPPLGVDQLTPAAVMSNGSFWHPIVVPGLQAALGPAWWALLSLVAVGIIAAVAAGRTTLIRMFGVVAIVALAGYLLTPASLGTRALPIEFVFSLRYATLPILLGAVLLPLLPGLRDRGSWVALVGSASVLAATQFDPGIWPIDQRRNRFADPVHGLAPIAGVAVGVTVLVVGIALISRQGRLPSWRPGVAGVAIVVVALAAAGAVEQRSYLRNRYANTSYLPVVSRWARDQRHERIAVVGTPLQYVLYGNSLTNYVQYVGSRGPHGAFATITDCVTWRRTLDAGHYSYVLTAPNPLINTAPIEALWTSRDPAVTVAVRDGNATVFEIHGRLDPAGCRRLGTRARTAAGA
jgi:hypothetical protein